MDINPSEVTGIIFAGGKSRRMGFDKALALYKGKPMIRYSIDLLKPFCSRILISSGNPLHQELGYETVADEYEGIGPMGGLLSCLHLSSTQVNICLPCDVPEMKPGIIKHMLDVYDNTSCVVPLTPLPEPLIAIYPKEVIGAIEELVKEKKYQMTGIFTRFPAKYVQIELKSSGDIFANINRPEDLDQSNYTNIP